MFRNFVTKTISIVQLVPLLIFTDILYSNLLMSASYLEYEYRYFHRPPLSTESRIVMKLCSHCIFQEPSAPSACTPVVPTD